MTERRFLPASPPKVKGRSISGYAAKFSVRSANLGTEEHPLYEIILQGAFDGVLGDDVICCFNHDESRILARSTGGKGSLTLSTDEIGLHYSFEAPDTSAGNDLLQSIKRGDINASSFAFTVGTGGDTFTREGSTTLRTITKLAKLYDVSPVARPAYPDATVSARSQSQPPSTPGIKNWSRLFSLIK